jgi:hypothetical protein
MSRFVCLDDTPESALGVEFGHDEGLLTWVDLRLCIWRSSGTWDLAI